ncbi:MAG TPA: hypothetical protein VKA87_04360 [Nitrososphaeraceae archaeon]|nr:hypothetical protein [Nitrososphaeraceae archaeon]
MSDGIIFSSNPDEIKQPIFWFNNFVGVGYRYHDVYMNVLPLFEDKRYAFKLWKKTIEWWPDDEMKLRFVEYNDKYWFILYGGSKYKGDNTGFVKHFHISENYKRFKHGYEKQVLLRFAIYKENKNKEMTDNKFDLELLKKSKTIFDIKFLNYSDLPFDSIESKCIQSMGGPNA